MALESTVVVLPMYCCVVRMGDGLGRSGATHEVRILADASLVLQKLLVETGGGREGLSERESRDISTAVWWVISGRAVGD